MHRAGSPASNGGTALRTASTPLSTISKVSSVACGSIPAEPGRLEADPQFGITQPGGLFGHANVRCPGSRQSSHTCARPFGQTAAGQPSAVRLRLKQICVPLQP